MRQVVEGVFEVSIVRDHHVLESLQICCALNHSWNLGVGHVEIYASLQIFLHIAHILPNRHLDHAYPSKIRHPKYQDPLG